MATLVLADAKAEALVAEPRQRLLKALQLATPHELEELENDQGQISALCDEVLKIEVDQ